MGNVVKYGNLMAFHPGFYLAKVIEEMEMSHSEFAKRLGTTPKTISLIVNGNSGVSEDIAKKLAIMLGTSVELWLNLQRNYELKILEIKAKEQEEEQINIARLIDYKYFVKYAGFPIVKTWKEKVANYCQYFKIANLTLLKQPDFLVNYRAGIGNTTEKNIVNAQAWLQMAMNESTKNTVKEFDEDKLKGYLQEIRSMTTLEQDVFLPRLREIFAECGVCFVLLPYLKNSGVNGVVKWFNSRKVLLAINDRRKDLDIFWFSLFHEIRHILQKKHSMVFLSEASGVDIVELNNRLENDADKFASSYLIPTDKYRRFVENSVIDRETIVEFAISVDIHPGIIVGRLQHDKLIGPSIYNDLKGQYNLIIA